MTSLKRKGCIVVVSGPSGAGKTTLCRRVLQSTDVEWSVSATTRPPRKAETDGVDYHFISREEFERRIKAGGFAEHAQVFDFLYGTPREPLDLLLRKGGCMLVDVDSQGARVLKERYGDAVVTVFVSPSRPEDLTGRLAGRKTETPEEMARRLAQARREIALGSQYDYAIVNDDLEKAVSEFRQLLDKIVRTG
ncbi:MAG: guanylate kinase [Planctomycetota bacterium]